VNAITDGSLERSLPLTLQGNLKVNILFVSTPPVTPTILEPTEPAPAPNSVQDAPAPGVVQDAPPAPAPEVVQDASPVPAPASTPSKIIINDATGAVVTIHQHSPASAPSPKSDAAPAAAPLKVDGMQKEENLGWRSIVNSMTIAIVLALQLQSAF